MSAPCTCTPVVLALALGGVVAGIIGVCLAVPAAGVISPVLNYVRNQPQPASLVAQTETEAVPG